ncbi:WD repeat-containing protein 87-like [Macadamia integrifolia]|uniref:WD repeat-containing protein 87-like n=1 Tax=Macadamia integrifolia TaxID=60698 RepID=UPI001C4FAA69|nr:WD repeat-containing protein 87-like [Macadamia integrifolia]
MKKCEDDAKAVNALLGSLVSNEFAKVVGCTTSKDIWDKLKSVHEGDDKIKEAKLQHHRNLFESLKMSEGETIDKFISKVNEIINSIRGLGAEVKDVVVVKKILRSLLNLYNPKVSAIEESKDMNKMKLDELHGTLIAYEMRIVKPKPTEKEATFKALKKLKINEDSEQKDSDDELIAYLARKLKKGRGKYKGKLPLKCFNCDGIGHFTSKCLKNDKLSDSEDENAQESMFKKGKKKVQHQTTEESEEEEEQEAQYDLIANLHSALTDLKEERKKMKDLEIQLVEKENQISQLNITVEDMAKINDELSVNLSSKAEECTTLEEKLEILKTEL